MARSDVAPAARSSATVGARSAARVLARFAIASEADLRMALVILVLRCFSDASAQAVRLRRCLRRGVLGHCARRSILDTVFRPDDDALQSFVWTPSWT
jgi:hypothetical protein